MSTATPALGSQLQDFTKLGFVKQLANTPGLNAEKRKELTTKYAAQRKTRDTKRAALRAELLKKD